MKTNINVKALTDAVHDEIAGTGLQFAVVVWRPGFMERGDPVAVGFRGKDDREAADALMKATDKLTQAMKDAREGTDAA